MSLLGSIFGSSSDVAGETSNSNNSNEKKAKKKIIEDHGLSLFQTSAALPDRPQHKLPAKPAERPDVEEEHGDSNRRRKHALLNDTENEEEEAALTNNNPKKKKRKERKTVPPPPASAAAAAAANNIDQTVDGEDKNGEGDPPLPTDEERTIFVGGLPLATTTRKSLVALFKDCGPIASTRLRSVPTQGIKLPPSKAGNQTLVKKICVNTHRIDLDTAKTTAQGYVVFRHVESVEKALQKNNMLVDGSGGGSTRLRVDRATPTMDASRSVFCGNLPYGADEVTLQDHFVRGCDLQSQDVVGVRIVRDKETYQCKGFGYVLLRERSMVATALKLHESTYKKKQIRVMVCGKRFKNKKGGTTTGSDAKNAAAATTTNTKSKDGLPPTSNKETVTVGAFRRIIAKQTKEASQINKRKRGGGEKKRSLTATKAGGGASSSGGAGLSRRAALDKKVDKRVKKLQKRMDKGMGKTRRA